MNCPCSSGEPYEKCCKPFHQGELPKKPVQLMRSRYSAYALDLADFIIDTTHPEHPQFISDKEAWRRDIHLFSQVTTFQKLDILDTTESTVTFRAHLTQGRRDASFTEKSLFEKVDGRWLYKSGEFQT